MQSLVIAAHGTDLSVLKSVLERENVSARVSEQVGPGVQLAQVPLESFDFALAVLPSAMQGLSAVLVEIGIVVGRRLPLLLVVPPDAALPAALAALPVARAALDNEAALELHLSLFKLSLDAASDLAPERPPAPTVLPATSVAQFRQRLADLRTAPGAARGRDFETLVVDVFRDSGAIVEQDKRLNAEMRVDAVAVIPGEEHRLGALLIEAKTFSHAPDLRRAEHQLQSYVLARGGGLGVLVYDSPQRPSQEHTTPLVLSVRADQLLEELQSRSLAEVVIGARNEAIHRL